MPINKPYGFPVTEIKKINEQMSLFNIYQFCALNNFMYVGEGQLNEAKGFWFIDYSNEYQFLSTNQIQEQLR